MPPLTPFPTRATTSTFGLVKVGSGLTINAGTGALDATAGPGGTVTSVSVTTANGVSGTVATATTTPAISLTLGAITPTSVNSVVLSGSSTPTLAVTGTTAVSGTNTGDQTSVSGNAGTVTVADAGGDTTTWVLLGTSQTGSLSPATDAGLTYNATTNELTLTSGSVKIGMTASAGSYATAETVLTFNRGDIPTTFLNKITASSSGSPVGNTINFMVASGASTTSPVLSLRGDGSMMLNQSIVFSSPNADMLLSVAGQGGIFRMLPSGNNIFFDNFGNVNGDIYFRSNNATGTPLNSLTLKGTTLWAGFNQTSPLAALHITPVVQTSGTAGGFILDGASHTSQTASTEINQFVLKTYTRSWATGAIITQRESVFNAPTYAAAAASVFTTAATVAISGPPIQGTNVTITTPLAFWVQSGNSKFDGTVTATSFSGAITGNADTATKLATARAINGVDFDGSAPITVTAAAGTLTGATLNSGVTASSLTSVGTIATGVWNGTAVDVAHGGSGDTSHTAYAVLCGGTTSTGVVQSVAAVGTSGQVLTSNGASNLPTFQTPSAASLTVKSFTGTRTANAANATISYAHGLGATPAWVMIFMSANNTTGSQGFWSSAASGSNEVFLLQGGNSNIDTNIVNYSDNGGAKAIATLSSVDATNVNLAWVKTLNPGAVAVQMLFIAST